MPDVFFLYTQLSGIDLGAVAGTQEAFPSTLLELLVAEEQEPRQYDYRQRDEDGAEDC